MGFRKRLFAWMYHNLLSDSGRPALDDPLTRDIRAPLLAQSRGDVLEIGAGDGSNLPLYPPDARLTLLEPNPFLLRHLREIVERSGLENATLVEAYAESLPYPDGSFDTVVSTHVLCSVKSQIDALAEVRRVLRPGGRFLFLEHVVAPSRTPTFHFQRLINPAWRFVGDNCHLTRDTGAAIRVAGFREVQLKSYQAGWPSFVSLHVVGCASV